MAKIYFEAIGAICPYCGGSIRSSWGSDMWALDEYLSTPSAPCTDCGREAKLPKPKYLRPCNEEIT